MQSSVYVAGVGVISAIGTTTEENFQALKHHRSGIAPMQNIDSIHRGKLPVGEVPLSNKELAEHTRVSEATSRTALLGLHAAGEALQDAQLTSDSRYRVGLISANTVGGMDKTESLFPEFLKNAAGINIADLLQHPCGHSTEVIARALRIRHFITTINTACSSSVNSIILGTRLIQRGKLDVVIAGGTDALTRFTLNGFNSLMILDKNLCRPFDASRAGLNLGEGAGFVVLVSGEVIKEKKLKAYAVVSGYGNTNDAFHQTASSPEGRGSAAAMENAMTMAGLSRANIDYINLHGTGTVNNDASEGAAIRSVFADRLPSVSSTKAYTGHTLGACGGIEAVFSVLALHHQCVFPNLRFETPVPETGIVPQQQFEKKTITHVMSNSFGFGGNCSSIILSKPVNR